MLTLEILSPVSKTFGYSTSYLSCSSYNWALHYSDVKDAFLRGDSFEEVYMEQPIGFVAQEETRMELS